MQVCSIHFGQQEIASFSVQIKVAIFFARMFMRLPADIPDYNFVA